MPQYHTDLARRVTAGLSRRQQMTQQGLPAALVTFGKLNLDGSDVVECPYSGLRMRAPVECPHCVVERMLLVKVAGKQLVSTGLTHGPMAAKVLSLRLLGSFVSN